jgi:hypothetical protein
MSCVDWEERIALYAGGDLSPVEAEAVEQHVAECAGCQVLLGGLRESLRLVREVHSEPIEAAHFAAVRARVLAELERAPARRWRFAWGFAMATAALVLLMAMWPRPEHRSVRQAFVPPAVHEGGADSLVRGGPPGPPPRAPRTARAQRKAGPGGPGTQKVPPRASAPPEPAEPMVVKLLTNDPDVVIYWITSTKGE